MYARTKGWDLGQVVVEVDYDQKSAPRRCTVRVQIQRSLAPEQIERLRRVAATCPVRRAIDEGITFEEHLTAADGTAIRAA